MKLDFHEKEAEMANLQVSQKLHKHRDILNKEIIILFLKMSLLKAKSASAIGHVNEPLRGRVFNLAVARFLLV